MTTHLHINRVIADSNQRTLLNNVDNISRTEFYEQYYYKHPEIKWALLAAMVSRNAGWNMTDLRNKWFLSLLNELDLNKLFSIYETGNWTIFDDACPQLLLYEQSKKQGKPLFHALSMFGVSSFMIEEWTRFWYKHDEERLCTALIINEQHVLQEAVIQKPLYKDIISKKLYYKVEQHTHLSYVILPTLQGSLYTLYVRQFQKVAQRINLGRKLAYLLFHRDVYPGVYAFIQKRGHTGSRSDYYVYTDWSPQVDSLPLRFLYPKIDHTQKKRHDWYQNQPEIQSYFSPIQEWKPVNRDLWIQQKWVAIYAAYRLKNLLM